MAREITYLALPMAVRESPVDFYALDAADLVSIVERDLSKSVASGAANTT